MCIRDRFVEDAKRDVDRMMRQAELDAKTKVSDSEVLYAAKEKARQMVARAEERCRQLYQVTNEYAEAVSYTHLGMPSSSRKYPFPVRTSRSRQSRSG